MTSKYENNIIIGYLRLVTNRWSQLRSITMSIINFGIWARKIRYVPRIKYLLNIVGAKQFCYKTNAKDQLKDWENESLQTGK